MKLKNILSLCLSLCLLTNVFSQAVEKKITGTVTDVKGQPLSGVSILSKGTNVGTMSDFDGKFSIEATPNSILVVSYVGYLSQNIPINNQSKLSVVMQEEVAALKEVVVVGYGTQKKEEITGSVTTVKAANLVKSGVSNLSNSLAGVTPGLIVNNRSGQPGADDATMYIRGKTSFGGGNDPLVVIDGIPDRNFNRLNPNDIESVSVLKDASAAIYGVQAANGVIIVTTKRGKIQKAKVNYSMTYTSQTPTRLPTTVNGMDYIKYVNELTVNQGGLPAYSDAAINLIKTDPNYVENTQWIKNVLFGQMAIMANHTLNVQGGNESVKYYVSGQFVNQGTNYRYADQSYQNVNLNTNLDFTLSKNLSVGVNLIARRESSKNPAFTDDNLMTYASYMYPYFPVDWLNGNRSGGSVGRNPAITSSPDAGYNNRTTTTLLPKLSFNWKLPFITSGLEFSGWGSYDIINADNKLFTKVYHYDAYDPISKTYTDQTGTSTNSVGLRSTNNEASTVFLKLGLHKELGDHSISSFIGFQEKQTYSKMVYAYRNNLLSPVLDQLFTGDPATQVTDAMESQYARVGFLGNVTYDYQKKYLINLLGSYSGSYNFAPGKQWGFFPSVSVGWRISEEDFFKPILPVVNNLKFRASVGLLGNDQVTPYYFLNKYQLQSNNGLLTYFGSDYTQRNGIVLSSVANPNVTWEEQKTRNVGFDAILFDNLNLSFDYFDNIRSNILAPRSSSIPLYSGLALPNENIGKTQNKGVEVNLGYNGKVGENFRYTVGFNVTYARNKILFRDESTDIPEWQQSTGHAVDGNLYYLTNGIYRSQADINNTAHLPGVVVGDTWIKDVDGNGIINSNDKVRIDITATPRIVYGIPMSFSYKNFALSMVLAGQAQAKQTIQNQFLDGVATPSQWYFDGRYSAENPNGIYPQAFNRNDTKNYLPSDMWLQNADFLRMKTIELSYQLPAEIISKLKLSNVRLSVGGNNPFLVYDHMSKFGVDPETDSGTGVRYPQVRQFKFGLDVGF